MSRRDAVRACLALLVGTCASGCFTLDFDKFLDGSPAPPDDGGDGEVTADASDGFAPADVNAGGCPRPWLIAALQASNESQSGQVARWPLTNSAPLPHPADCSSFDTTYSSATAVAALDRGQISAATQSGTFLIDPATGSTPFQIEGLSGYVAIGTFATQLATGSNTFAPAFAVTMATNGTSTLSRARISQTAHYGPTDWDLTQVQLPAPIVDMAPDPMSPNGVLVAIPGSASAAQLVWGATGGLVTLASDLPGYTVQTIATDPSGRIVWTGQNSQGGTDFAVFTATEANIGASGPFQCSSAVCPSNVYLYAIPDPARATGVIALCAQGGMNSIVRWDTQDPSTCVTLVAPSDVGSGFAIRRFAIAP